MSKTDADNLQKSVQLLDKKFAFQTDDYYAAQKGIGRSARAIREKTEISLRELARRMNISATHASDLERGNRLWKLKTVRSWRKAMGI